MGLSLRVIVLQKVIFDLYLSHFYANFAELTNPGINDDNLQEEALKHCGILKLNNQSTFKVLSDRIRNFQSAIDLLCNPLTGCYKNVPVTVIDPETKKPKVCRFNQKAQCLLYLSESSCNIFNEFKNSRKLIPCCRAC